MTRLIRNLRTRKISKRMAIGLGACLLGTLVTAAVAAPLIIRFVIVGGVVRLQDPFAARITMLGAAIYHSGDKYHMPVTTEVVFRRPDGTSMSVNAFGDPTNPLTSNVNWQVAGSTLPDRPLVHRVRTMNLAGTEVKVIGTSWIRSGSGWKVYKTRDSSVSGAFVKVLRNGDSVPNVAGFMDQASVEDYLHRYINVATQTVTLSPNQAIYLFELGTDNLSAASCDFQDLVMLLTVADSEATLDEDESGGATTIIPPTTGD